MSTSQQRYRSTRPLDERVDLLSQMTLDEKIAQLGCLWSTALVRDDTFDADFTASECHSIGR
jgi:beta-glucosidase